MTPMSIWTLIQAYIDENGSSEAWIQRRAGLNKGTFTAWRARGVPALPTQTQLLGLASAIRVPYEDVVLACLHDCGYLPEAAARRVELTAAVHDLQRTKEAEAALAATLAEFNGDVAAAQRAERERANPGSERFAFKLILNRAMSADEITKEMAEQVKQDEMRVAQAEADLAKLSDAPTRTDVALAADDQEQSIAGEQESPDTP